MKNDACFLIIDDNSSDLDLIYRAINSCHGSAKIVLMNDGNDSISYLMGTGEYADRTIHPYPTLIISDLNMPGVDGFDILEHLKINPSWMVVPTIIFSSSQDPDDIRTSYKLGASAYHVKPHNYPEFEKTIIAIIEYWSKVEKPIVETTGQLVVTNSEGKHGSRFVKPKNFDQIRKITV